MTFLGLSSSSFKWCASMQKSLLALFTGKVLASCREGNQASGRMHSSLTRGAPLQNVWQKHFNSTRGYYAIRTNVWQTWMLHYKHSHFHSSCSAETGPDQSSVHRCFFTYFDKTFFVRKLEFNRTTVVTVSKMIQRKDNLKRKNKEVHCSGGC